MELVTIVQTRKTKQSQATGPVERLSFLVEILQVGGKMKKVLREFVKAVLEQANQISCPLATQDVALNTKNRNSTRDNHDYGPLNPAEPGNYWKDLAKKWKTTEKAAKKSLCGNCVAFDISDRMKDCMPGEVSEGAGELGYCWMHHFKCASLRSCDTWAFGGPIDQNEVSIGWQEKAKV